MPRLKRISVSGDQFVDSDGLPWLPWGQQDSLIDQQGSTWDMWDDATIRKAARNDKARGRNVARLHLTYARFMDSLTDVNTKAYDRLRRMMQILDEERLYCIITIASFWHENTDWPDAWHSASESVKWDSWALHAGRVARACRGIKAALAIDVGNELVAGEGGNTGWSAAGASSSKGLWHTGNLSGNWFATYISIDPDAGGRSIAGMVNQFMEKVGGAIRQENPEILITAGMLPSFDDFRQAFGQNPYIDFVSLHEYPTSTSQYNASLTRAVQHSVWGKPFIWEEFGPSKTLLSAPVRRGYLLDALATPYKVKGFFDGAGAGTDPSALSDGDVDLDAIAPFFRPFEMPRNELGLWLAPTGHPGKTDWTRSTEMVNAGEVGWQTMRGAGELPPDATPPLHKRDSRSAEFNTEPFDPARYLHYNPATAALIHGLSFNDVPAGLGNAKRVELWVRCNAPVSAIARADAKFGTWTGIFMYLGAGPFNIPVDGWFKNVYQGEITESQLNGLEVTLTTTTDTTDTQAVQVQRVRVLVVWDRPERWSPV